MSKRVAAVVEAGGRTKRAGPGWKMEAPCADCPFNKSGEGLHLRKTLRGGRWTAILQALRSDGHFICHKTTEETGNGTNLVCAGSMRWQAERGLSSQYVRICERLEYFAEKRLEEEPDLGR